MAKRKGLSKKIRFEVFKRDSFACQYCGAKAPEILLTIDHVVPVAKGGTDDPMNLVAACGSCNGGKSDRALSDDAVLTKKRAQLDTMAERREQVELMLEWQKDLESGRERLLEHIAQKWNGLTSGFVLNDFGLHKLRCLLRRFPLDEIVTSMDISAAQYFRRDKAGALTQESVTRAFDYIPRIATVRKSEVNDPSLRDLYYIRGILRNRMSYVWPDIIARLSAARDLGIPVDALKTLALKERNWTSFKASFEAAMAAQGGRS